MGQPYLGHPNVNSKKFIDALLRRQTALQYRTASLTYRDIFNEMVARFGKENLPTTYDERYVYRDIKQELDRLKREMLESAVDLRLVEMERLDMLQQAVMPEALNGNLKAVDRVLAIMKHRALLMGLNAPVSTKLEVRDWRMEVIDLIRTGKITRQQAEEELGSEVVNQLLESGSADVVEGSYAEEEGGGE